jgi:hypothetical protein
LRCVRFDRHCEQPCRRLSFGCLNIRSLNNKVDEFLHICRSLSLDVVFLTDTWHDADWVCIARLRAEGFRVGERVRLFVVEKTTPRL